MGLYLTDSAEFSRQIQNKQLILIKKIPLVLLGFFLCFLQKQKEILTL